MLHIEQKPPPHFVAFVRWIDMENMMARVEAGVVGLPLEETLAKHGVCTGHTPDSYEFSTLGMRVLCPFAFVPITRNRQASLLFLRMLACVLLSFVHVSS